MIRRAVAILVLLGAVLVSAPAYADRVVIPSLGVNAEIVEVGVSGSTQDMPRSLWTVGHWKRGVKPCAPGSTVLAGHTYEGGRAVFNGLGRLRKGAVVRIERPGPDCTYRVTANYVQPRSESVASCYSWDGPARGCLITCVGRIGPGNYTHRRIVKIVLRNRLTSTSR